MLYHIINEFGVVADQLSLCNIIEIGMGSGDPLPPQTQWYCHSTPYSGSFVIILFHKALPHSITSLTNRTVLLNMFTF